MESNRFNPRQTLLAALVAAACCTSAQAASKVSWEDILNDDKTTQDVLSYGLGLKAQRYSPLAKINTKNVEHLVPAWSFSFGGEKQRGQEAQALVHDGVIYVTASYSRIYAVDARSGKRLWEYEARLPDDIRPCCDVINRGAAIYGDKVYFGTLDAAIVALDKNTGKVVWRKKFGGMDVSEAKRLRQLEDENRRLKHLVADLTLDKQALTAALGKKW